MGQAAGCRVLAIIGSGETSPTMVTVHRGLTARLAARQPAAILLDTPYAFQENAGDVSARARAYFAHSVGLDVASGDGPLAGDGLAAVRSADWVFAGPGSPSYALARWREDGTAQALRDRIAGGTGVTVMASAAAATVGCVALPVYEVYKAGAEPHWLEGLDLMVACGLRVAVIPHYDNAEGGTHDTRYCYLGERRLAILERQLPEGAAVLGVDEHTALVIDLDARQAEVAGRGTVTVRRAGHSTLLPAGTALPLTRLQSLARHGPAGVMLPATAAGATGTAEAPNGQGATLTEITTATASRFEEAAAARDVPTMVAAILNLEEAISDWAADTEEDQGTTQSRAVLRGLIARLGEVTAAALAGNPARRLAVAAESLLRVRADLRAQGLYPAADAIRDALTAADVQVRDTPGGTRWQAQRPLPALTRWPRAGRSGRPGWCPARRTRRAGPPPRPGHGPGFGGRGRSLAAGAAPQVASGR
jgi:cyanophycinase-like exopeptidase